MAHGETYGQFVGKFERKRTTDDCFTPPEVYEAVADYVSKRFGVERDRMVRPFWPDADYETFDYPPGAVVADRQQKRRFGIAHKITANVTYQAARHLNAANSASLSFKAQGG